MDRRPTLGVDRRPTFGAPGRPSAFGQATIRFFDEGDRHQAANWEDVVLPPDDEPETRPRGGSFDRVPRQRGALVTLIIFGLCLVVGVGFGVKALFRTGWKVGASAEAFSHSPPRAAPPPLITPLPPSQAATTPAPTEAPPAPVPAAATVPAAMVADPDDSASARAAAGPTGHTDSETAPDPDRVAGQAPTAQAGSNAQPGSPTAVPQDGDAAPSPPTFAASASSKSPRKAVHKTSDVGRTRRRAASEELPSALDHQADPRATRATESVAPPQRDEQAPSISPPRLIVPPPEHPAPAPSESTESDPFQP